MSSKIMNVKTTLLFVFLSVTAFAVACGGTTTVVQQAPSANADAGTAAPTGDDDDSTAGDDDDTTTPAECTAARKRDLGQQSKVATGEVKVLETVNGVTKIFVDAVAGGTSATAKTLPRIYIKLDGTKVEVNDLEADASKDWDLAFKRVDIYTNGGDGGPGQGGAIAVGKAFDDVTMEDATGVAGEVFYKGECEFQKDEAGFVLTTFSSWYDYDQETHFPTPFLDRAFVVKSADGTLYKVGLLSYVGKNTGELTGGKTGAFVFQVKKL